MLPIAKKYVVFSASAAVAVALQAFADNFVAVLHGLESVWERIQDPPSALPAIKQLVEEANAKLAEAEALGLQFGMMTAPDSSSGLHGGGGPQQAQQQ